jgi:hypothetical protein
MTRLEALNILKLNLNADERAIKKNYRKLAFQFHPDLNKSKNAEQQFILIKQAYEYLINSQIEGVYETAFDKLNKQEQKRKEDKEYRKYRSYYQRRQNPNFQEKAAYERNKIFEELKSSGYYMFGKVLYYIVLVLYLFFGTIIFFIPIIYAIAVPKLKSFLMAIPFLIVGFLFFLNASEIRKKIKFYFTLDE